MTTRLVWLSDIHLNFVESMNRKALPFLEHVKAGRPDSVVITGDIGEAPSIERYLAMMAHHWQVPIYFVLGNHDFYRGSIRDVRSRVGLLAAESEHLVYLTQAGVVQLSSNTCLIGHDSWADARLGDYDNSGVVLNDYILIDELANLDMAEIKRELRAQGDIAAGYFREMLRSAVQRYRHVLVATHVPPFQAACRYRGRISDDSYLPHFACKAAGDAIRKVAETRPDVQMAVLCGHTHSFGVAEILGNLIVYTAEVEYYRPVVQRVFEIE